MTLDTRIYLLGQFDRRELFAKCNQLIGAHEHIQFVDKQVGNEWWLYNKPDQGLCALLDVRYRPDGPLYAGTSHWDDCEPDCDYGPHLLPRWLEVSLDTGYGYRGENGETCSQLHARLVFELGQWLDEKGIAWKWENEFTGDVHDRYEGLDGLVGDGAKADAWFTSTVAPVLQALQ